MKRLLFIAILSLHFIAGFSQCDKKVSYKSISGRFVQGDTKHPDMALNATIQIDKEKIVFEISIGGNTMTTTSTIKTVETCDWKEYLKSGKSVYKVVTDKEGVFENSIIKVIGKDGKITIYFGSDPDDKGGLELDISDSKIES